MASPLDQNPLDQKLAEPLGGRTAAALGKGLGLHTVGDLLSHYPRRYARRGELTALTDLPLDENVTIVAEVLEVRNRSMRAKKGSILEVTISDGLGLLTLTFFNQAWRAAELKPGARGIFAGKVGDYRGTKQLAHPDYELFEPSEDTDPAGSDPAGSDPHRAKAWAELPIPIYPATSTVASWQLQKAIGAVLDTLAPLDDPVPDAVRSSRALMPFARALELVHRPRGRRGLGCRAQSPSLPGGLRAAGRAAAAAGAVAVDRCYCPVRGGVARWLRRRPAVHPHW